MNTDQIQCCIECDPLLRENVIGVFASDRLPNQEFQRPYGLIVNTDTHSKPGRHWCSIYSDKRGHIEFFDSYGKSPKDNSVTISQWINNKAKTITFNRNKLQSDQSSLCGQYCILYLRQRLLGNTLEQFINVFDTSNVEENDLYVFEVMSQAYSNCIDHASNAINQSCTSLNYCFS